MIYTCTTNPSLDYYITIPELKIGTDMRSENEMYDAGGKGVNVSIVLNNFRIPNVCLGFLGGFVKDYYLDFISNYPNIQPLFTPIKDNTRINLKIVDYKDETGINAKGPIITDEEFDKFRSRLSNIYSGDVFVLSGNIQNEIKDRMIDIVRQLIDEGVKVVLDSDLDILERCIGLKLFAVKLNRNNMPNDTDIIDYGKYLVENGIENVLYSTRNEKSYLITNNEVLECDSLNGSLINVTGTSDSLVAGFLYGKIRAADSIESFKYANAASLATVMSNDLGSKEKIEELFETIKVNSL